MVIDVFTLFPEWFNWFLRQRHVRNTLRHGHDLRVFNLRDTTPLPHGQVDDTPYGGGAGMVLRVDVVDAALQAVYGTATSESVRAQDSVAHAGRGGQRRTLVLAPAGQQLDDVLAGELAQLDTLTLLCGRYEGMDDRVREHLADGALSIGPYVLAGGELAAMVVADAVMRKLAGALGCEESAVEESFSEALEGAPEYPHYTRPASYRGWDVPDVLLSGDHARIRRWRLEQSAARRSEANR
jgi:tRNA (guanine37-N1)-methyltransferase